MIYWFVVDAMDAFDAMVLLPGNLQNENEMAAKATNGDESQWIMYCEMYNLCLGKSVVTVSHLAVNHLKYLNFLKVSLFREILFNKCDSLNY